MLVNIIGKIVGLIFAVAFGATILAVLLYFDGLSDSGNGCGSSPSAASSFGEQAVEDSLKSPSSAKFRNVQAHPDTECAYLVAGQVEAENSFGAMMANNFSVVVTFHEEGGFSTDMPLITPR